MTTPRNAKDQLVEAALAAAPDTASAEAGAQLVAAAVMSSAQGRVFYNTLPSAETLGMMADAVSELSLQTGAKVPDVAHLALCAATLAARISGISYDELAQRLARIYRAPMLRSTVSA